VSDAEKGHDSEVKPDGRGRWVRQISDDGMHERITTPTLADRDLLIARLEKAFYVRDAKTHEPLPATSNFHPNGLAVPVFTRKGDAGQMRDHMAEAYEISTEVQPIQGLWDFLRECAQGGAEGALLDNYYPVTFFNRLTDMDRRLPSLMWMRFPDSTNDIYGFFFGRTGIVDMAPGTTVKWIDFERFDRASDKFCLYGDVLPEIVDAHAIVDAHGVSPVFLKGAEFLGPYVSDVGAIPVFSAHQWAWYFAYQHGIINRDGSPRDGANHDLRVQRIDLFPFLDAVHANHGPFVDIGLNPLAARYRQGWFFKVDDKWMVETITGVWEVSENKVLARPDIQPPKSSTSSRNRPSDSDSPPTSVVMFPFKEFCGANRSPMPLEDAEALVDRELAEPEDALVPDCDAGTTPPAESFVIDAFDKITGDKLSFMICGDSDATLGFLVFPNIVAAARYLIHEILPHDEETRIHGWQLCHGAGSSGSNNPEREASVTRSVVAAIRKILISALTEGYRPEHAAHLKRVIQDATVTCEITECGYFGDLLFYGLADGEDVWDRLDPENFEAEDDDDEEVDSEPEELVKVRSRLIAMRDTLAAKAEVAPEMALRLRRALGEAYERASSESILIAKTMLEEFDRVKQRPGYDYAGISMKSAKLVERELKRRVFEPWRAMVREKLGKSGLAEIRQSLAEQGADRTTQTLLDWLEKRSKVELGGMRYALKAVRQTCPRHEIVETLATFLKELRDGDWLVSDMFDTILENISTKYRNGGVHEHVVTYDICSEAIERIVTGADPVLARLLLATEAG
jgi:hypothetical protein